MKRIYSLIIKEFLAVWQDKKSRFMLIVPPLIQLFIFAFAATLDVTNVSFGVLNRDSGKQSFELIQRFKGAPFFRTMTTFDSEQELKEAIDTQRVMMALHIDEQFSRNILSKRAAELQVILDGRKSNTSQIILGYTQRIVDQYNQDLKLTTPTTEVIPRTWFNPNLLYTWFTVPGLVVILTMTTCLVVTSLSVAREKELGTFDQLLVSPLRPLDILIGKSIPGIIFGMAEGSIIIIAAVLAFDIPFRGSLLALYFSLFCFVTSIVGIGLFLSSLCKTQQQALLAGFLFIAPVIALSGFAAPIENMPIWLQHITLINPLRYMMVIVRGLFLKGISFSTVWQNTYPVVLIAIFNLVGAAWFFRRRLE